MRARTILTLITLVVIGVLIWLDLGRTSPGDLGPAHAGITELEGQAGCIACHGSNDITMGQACGECHEATLASIKENRGLHGTLPKEVPATDCGPCHREHHGDELESISKASFKLAGFASREEFDHDRIGYTLDGAHKGLECTACHKNADLARLPEDESRFLGLSTACASCHEDQHTQAFLQEAAKRAGLEVDESCAACHTTSKDGFRAEKSRLTPAASEALDIAPAAERRAAHALFGFTLDAPHSEAACAACHGPTSTSPTTSEGRALVARTEDAPLFPGRDQDDCTACHADPHAAANGSSCLDCHQSRGPWDDLSAFGHEAFSLAGVHAEAACTDCHQETGPTSTLALSTRRDQGQLNVPRSCTDCHDDPHAEDFIANVAASLKLTASGTCTTCHATDPAPSNSGGPGFRVADADFPLELHDAAGFSLIAPHEEVACAGCHAGSDELVPASFLRKDSPSFVVSGAPRSGAPFQDRFHTGEAPRSQDDCAACHADPHGEDFKDSAIAASPKDCQACHTPASFLPSTFGTKKHQSARFKLDGAHLAVGCYRCHTLEEGQLCPQFTSASSACADCHEDVHAGAQLSDLGASTAEGLPAEEGCARCHTTSDFQTVRELDHEAWFGFKLTGAHETAACENCHRPEPKGTPKAREFGRIEVVFPGKVGECSTCHDDVHEGRFDKYYAPKEVEGRTSCARCHNQTSFAMDAESTVFDHGLWTRFDLEGVHADVACTGCHNQPGSTPSGLPATAGTQCIDCHQDIHLGQFEQNGADTDCARCHSTDPDTGAGFKAALFDHDRDSAFALDETHAKLECAACHRAWPLKGGGEVIRYKPLGTTCADCHGVVPK